MIDLLGSPGHLEEAETPDTCTTFRGMAVELQGYCSYAPVKMRTEIKVNFVYYIKNDHNKNLPTLEGWYCKVSKV